MRALFGKSSDRTRSWLALALVTLVVTVLIPVLPVLAGASRSYYLNGDGVPTASMTESPPKNVQLPDHDGQDEEPGLLLEKTDRGVYETDPSKFQMWIADANPGKLAGPARVEIYASPKEFESDKIGNFDAYLLDCDPGGFGCLLLAQDDEDVEGTGDWVAVTLDFGSVTHEIEPDRVLAVMVVVDDDSDDDMWFAYGTATYASSLSVTLGSVTTTTSTSTTTISSKVTTSTAKATTTSTTSTTIGVPETTTTTTVHIQPIETTTTTTSTTQPHREPTPAPTTVTTRVPVDQDPDDQSGVGGVPPPREPPSADPELAPLPNSSRVIGEAPQAPPAGPVSGLLLSGLEIVVPPAVADVLVSPLLVLEVLLRALTESGRAVVLPAAFLAVATGWIVTRGKGGFRIGVLERAPERDR